MIHKGIKNVLFWRELRRRQRTARPLQALLQGQAVDEMYTQLGSSTTPPSCRNSRG